MKKKKEDEVKNPFEDLQKQAAKNDEKHFKESTGQDRPKSAKEEKLKALSGQYSDMVTEVLTQLKDAMYPGAYVISETCCWIIKYSTFLQQGIGGFRRHETVVKVTLKIDAGQNPTYFLCAVKSDSRSLLLRTWRRKSGLSREDLTKTLADLAATKPSLRQTIESIRDFVFYDFHVPLTWLVFLVIILLVATRWWWLPAIKPYIADLLSRL